MLSSKLSQNKIMNLTNFLILLLVIRFISGVFYSLVPVHGVHIWRQTDVISVAYSYYLRYFVEHNFLHFLLPSVLNTDAGEFSIVRMEFPLLNFILAPCFAFGPYWGKVFANLTVILINYTLVFVNYQLLKNIRIANVSAGLSVLLLVNFSFTATWTTRVMPDVVSMLLVFTAVSLSWSNPKTKLSLLFATLGILIKPTSLIVLLLNLLKQSTFSSYLKSKQLKVDLIWSGLSIAVGLIYYLGVTKYIGLFERHSHFNMEISNPINQFMSFIGNEGGLNYLFNVRFLCSPYIAWLIPGIAQIGLPLIPYFGLLIFSVSAMLYMVFAQTIIAWRVMIVLCLQIMIIAALDGEHSFVHFYYYVGTTFAVSLIFIGYLDRAWLWLKPFLILIILIQMGDLLNFEIGDFFTRHFQWTPQSRVAFYDECTKLKLNNPTLPWGRGYVFAGPKTDNEQSAALGICFGERERGTLADYGFYYKWDNIPDSCQIIDNTKHINLVKCKN